MVGPNPDLELLCRALKDCSMSENATLGKMQKTVLCILLRILSSVSRSIATEFVCEISSTYEGVYCHDVGQIL